MAKKHRKFADDGWAIWIDGDDNSTVYINDWLNPKGNSHIDIAVRIRGIKDCKAMHIYAPFTVSQNEIEDVSMLFNDTKILQATFSAACIVDYMKNEHTSEIAYNGKTVDIVHISTLDYDVKQVAEGTLISVDFGALQPFLDNDEGYFVWRMPHKTLNDIFKIHVNVGSTLARLRDLITTPVVSEKYGYSIRINESRLLPEEITRMGGFNRQKLKKAVVTLFIDENYEINDAGCYRIRRLEENLYSKYLPAKYKCDDIISYQWNQDRENNLLGHFNFYYSIAKDSVNGSSMSLYMVILMIIAVAGEILADFVKIWLGLA
jgi:hypothetical protein